MLNNEMLMNSFKKDVKKLENKIEHRKLHNLKNYIVISIIKSGIFLDYALPFILVAIILFHLSETTPFILDDIEEKAKIEKMVTSTGLEENNVSFDYDYDKESLEYSTGWKLNEYGLYERTITTYKIDDSIDLEDTDNIFSMTKEEIEEILIVTNIKTIQKSDLDSEDDFYNEDMFIINTVSESDEYVRTVKESKGANIFSTIWYILVVLCWGKGLKGLEKIFVKTNVSDKLKEIQPKFRPIKKQELQELQKILKLKKENLTMLDDNSKSLSPKTIESDSDSLFSKTIEDDSTYLLSNKVYKYKNRGA